MVKRITITIKNDILKRIDNTIDDKLIRNRSHAIESLLLKSFLKDNISTAIILAGGIGARLRPITYELPKALIPIHGKPVLEHQITMLRKFGVNDILISLCYMHKKVQNYLTDSSNTRYFIEKNPLGTAGALFAAREFIRNTFVVINVDTLLNPNLNEILKFHKENGAIATMLLTTSNYTDEAGVARIRGNRIVEFVQAGHEPKLVNAGLYIFEPGIKKFLKKKGSLEKIVFPLLARRGQLAGYVHDGPVFDVGFPKGYEKAIKLWKGVS
jgi:NDP-sugar pyrophosphorylase family protein